MEEDGGGWTVFQRRMDGSVNFTRTWSEYKNGFGNLSTEFWLGNKYLYSILRQGNYELRMDMRDFEGDSRFVKYKNVSVGNGRSKYRMNISGYSGNTGDCFTAGNTIHDMRFSTWDKDNDNSDGICAVAYKGGWWYNKCHACNPNGLYLRGPNQQHAKGITDHAWRGHDYSLKGIEIMADTVHKMTYDTGISTFCDIKHCSDNQPCQ
ncbi:fibrinogen-like protein 1 [Ostrea edulis]|uniref:fibrinogen-like protein 1 n=1 Tax=Ostrea edulis TaxID=37623 RepID=UPI0024AF987E|nr:fibrinogen-like protein 1 [Ostrea edulis]